MSPAGPDRRRWARPALAAAAAIVALNLALVAAAELAPGPSGPAGSSYATSSRGLGAWAELLERSGHAVERLRKRPDRAPLDPRATMVLAAPDTLTRGEAAALGSFVRGGGRLIAVVGSEPDWVDRLVPERPPWREDAPKEWVAAPGARAAGGARRVESAGDGAWSTGEGAIVRSGSGEALVLSEREGDGTLILVADTSPLENRLLDHDDNAALALALVGDRRRPVQFAEAFHGYGEGRGLGALPGRWRLALFGVGLAIALAMLAAARRIGPPDAEPLAAAPARREFVDATGLTLERSGDAAEALEPVRRSLERRIASRCALRQPSDLELEQAGLELGLEPDEAQAAAGRSDDVLALGRALARLSQSERYGHRVTRR